MRALTLSMFLMLSALFTDPAPQVVSLDGETMGTSWSVQAVDAPDGMAPEALRSRIEAALAQVNGAMNNWDPTSEISRFNAAPAGTAHPVSAPLATVIQAADVIHAASGGKFDVTLAPLIDLWGFGPKEPGDPIPEDADIAAAKALVGQSTALIRDGATLAKSADGVSVNLSAIAKGYGVDAIAAALEEAGITRYLVEIGGDLAASGRNAEGVPWSVGIERPDAGTGSLELVVPVNDRALATSGDYRNFFEHDGIRYSHILDPVAGRPITHATASVTVLADSAMLADGWATALLVLGAEQGMQVAEAEGLAAFFIARGPSGFVTFHSDAFDALMASD